VWECEYHVVFIPKCRRKALYVQLRRELAGDRAVFNAVTNPASQYAGTNTVVIPGAEEASASPDGDGYGVVKLTSGGTIKLTATPAAATNRVVRLQTCVPGPNTNTLTLSGIPNHQYVVQFVPNLTASSWFRVILENNFRMEILNPLSRPPATLSPLSGERDGVLHL
jgi:hypothetical protein